MANVYTGITLVVYSLPAASYSPHLTAAAGRLESDQVL